MADRAIRGCLNSVHSQAQPLALLMKRDLAGHTIGRSDALQCCPGMHCGFCFAALLDEGLRQRGMRPAQCLISGHKLCCLYLQNWASLVSTYIALHDWLGILKQDR